MAAGSFAVVSAQQQPAGAASPQRAFINQYCVSCHSDKLKTGGLVLENLNIDNVAQNPDVWDKVLHKLGARYMPPPGVPRPDEKSYQSVVNYLETSLDKWASSKPMPGRTASMRRLNRTEYHNAIRDLLGLDIDAASMLPADETSYGFDNMAGTLTLSATLVEAYVSSAEKISRLAMGEPVTPSLYVYRAPEDSSQDYHVEGLPFGTRGGVLLPYVFPSEGEYRITITPIFGDNMSPTGFGSVPCEKIEVLLDGEIGRAHV